MCLDIDPNSVIHKHLCLKSTSTCYENRDGLQSKLLYSEILPSHNLTMLPSFHISLDPPFPELDHVGNSITVRTDYFDLRAVIGEVVLANIHISEKDGKKSAWIPLHPDLVDKFMPHHHNHRHYASPNNPDEGNAMLLHISLANLTGNPHDSIARPEDCIIDTINN